MIGLESRGRHRLSIVATLIGAYKNYGTAYLTIAVIALVGNILPLVTRIPRKRQLRAGLGGVAASQLNGSRSSATMTA